LLRLINVNDYLFLGILAVEPEGIKHNYQVTLSRKLFNPIKLEANCPHIETISNMLLLDSD